MCDVGCAFALRASVGGMLLLLLLLLLRYYPEKKFLNGSA